MKNLLKCLIACAALAAVVLAALCYLGIIDPEQIIEFIKNIEK